MTGRLGFVGLARRSFSFLEELGFELVQWDDTSVRFEATTVFVDIFHEERSYEVGFELGRTTHRERYSGHEVLSFIAPDRIEAAHCQTTDPEVLAQCLAAIAEILRTAGKGLLAGEPAAFDAMRAKIEPRRAEITLQAQFGATMDRADRAWEEKAFVLAERLYRDAEPALDATRKRRLTYLQKRRL